MEELQELAELLRDEYWVYTTDSRRGEQIMLSARQDVIDFIEENLRDISEETGISLEPLIEAVEKDPREHSEEFEIALEEFFTECI